MRVLDLDMDYFMREVVYNNDSEPTERLNEEEFGECVWKEKEVRAFFNTNLGLSKDKPIPGRVFTEHKNALFFWEELVEKNMLKTPFEVVHIDSHADLSSGTATSSFLQSPFLTFSVETRKKIRNYEFAGKNVTISSGDYLLWAIGYKMISKLIYCTNPESCIADYPLNIMKDFKEKLYYSKQITKNIIQLKYNKKMEILNDSKEIEEKRELFLRDCIVDPEVEMTIIPTIEAVNYNGNFDYISMAQSPNYTPESADYIMDIFQEYIKQI